MPPKVSIIILNWNGREYLQDCLTSVFSQTYDNYKVIFIDNCSTDNSLSFVKENFPQAAIIALNENYGFAKGNNIGIKYALEKYNPAYILLLNNDIKIVQKDALNKLVSVAENDEQVGVLGCKLIYPDGKIQNIGMKIKPLSQWITFWIQDLKKPVCEPYRVDVAMAAVFLIKRSLIDRIGLFDEDFLPFYYEETDYCMRAKRHGYFTGVVPSIRVIHHRGQSIKKQPLNYVSLTFKKNSVRFMLLDFSVYLLVLRIVYELYLLVSHLLINTKLRNNLKEALLFYLQPFFFSKKELKNIIAKRMHRYRKVWY